jgi:hypothetical protein
MEIAKFLMRTFTCRSTFLSGTGAGAAHVVGGAAGCAGGGGGRHPHGLQGGGLPHPLLHLARLQRK